MQYGIHEVLTNCSEPLLLSLLQGCCDSRLLCLPNAMSSFTQYTYVDRTRPPEPEISSPRKPRITSKFLFEFKEKSRKTSPMNVARLITPGGQNALRPLLLELVNNLQILSIYTEPFFLQGQYQANYLTAGNALKQPTESHIISSMCGIRVIRILYISTK